MRHLVNTPCRWVTDVKRGCFSCCKVNIPRLHFKDFCLFFSCSVGNAQENSLDHLHNISGYLWQVFYSTYQILIFTKSSIVIKQIKFSPTKIDMRSVNLPLVNCSIPLRILASTSNMKNITRVYEL